MIVEVVGGISALGQAYLFLGTAKPRKQRSSRKAIFICVLFGGSCLQFPLSSVTALALC